MVSIFPQQERFVRDSSTESQRVEAPYELRLCVAGSHGQELAPFLAPELGADDAGDAGADGVSRLADEDAGVVVEADGRSVSALGGVLCADDDSLAYVPATDLVGGGNGAEARGVVAVFFHDDDDAVTNAGVTLLADNESALDEGGARVVDALEDRLELDHDGRR